MMNHLPSLIKETVNFYEWNANLKILNNEYYDRVKILSPTLQPYIIHLTWDQPEQNGFVVTRMILYLKYPNGYWVNWTVKSFIKSTRRTICRPQRYYYSSGCSNLAGYSWDQVTLPHKLHFHEFSLI